MEYEWIKLVATRSTNFMTIIFHNNFNEFIKPNSLPNNITKLVFRNKFNQKIEPKTLPKNLITLEFGDSS